jgi:hypothetical protein
MNAPPGRDFFEFDDLFNSGGWFPLPAANGQLSLHYIVLDRLLITEDVSSKSVILIMRDSTHPQQPGVGVALTVGQATQVMLLIQKSIAKLESSSGMPE